MSESRTPDTELFPILPLRNSVVFPASVVPINVGRARSVRLVEDLVGQERAVVGIVSQRDAEVDEPRFRRSLRGRDVARVVKVHPPRAQQLLGRPPRPRALPDRRSPATLEPYMRARGEAHPEDLERDAELDALGASLRESMRQVLA
jgi:ATP-dependent Lon protease